MNDAKRIKVPFIVFEGIDGSGKDYLCNRLVEDFAKNDLGSFWKTEEPYLEHITGKQLRQALSSKDFDQNSILDLFLQNRFAHTLVILEKLKKNIAVFSVRYDLSTYAYQGIFQKSLGAFFEQVYQRHCYQMAGNNFESDDFLNDKAKSLIPTITVFCDVKVDVAIERLKKRMEKSKKGLEYFEEVKKLEVISKNYQKAFDYVEERDNRLIVKIDANEEQEVVFEKAKIALRKLEVF